MPESVLLAGGGTAGHVNPLLALADELRRRDPACRIVVLGTSAGLEAELVPARGYRLQPVPRVPLPRRPTPQWLLLPSRLTAAVRAAGRAIDDAAADVVVGFGGYVSTPAYLAARRRRLPMVLHEQNARPGLANRLGARLGAAVATTFPGTPLPGAVVTGLPLRAEIAELAAARAEGGARRADAARRGLAELGLDPRRPLLLVTGGSTGALRLNAAVAGAAAALLAAGAQVLHLTGKGKDGPVREALSAAGLPEDLAAHYHVLTYLTAMEHAYAAADLVVCRAGAGMVAELSALGLPAVYVPLPVGNGEQRLNAAAVVEAGGGLLVADAELTPAWCAEHLAALLADAEALAAMGAAAAGAGTVDGAARLADLVMAVR